MSRIRYLKPDFFKDEDLAEHPYWIRLLFAGLWNIADKEGRLEDRIKRIKIDVFPYDNVDVEKGLQKLSKPKNGSKKPFIQRYDINGDKYIQIITWHKHQRPHHTEKESIIPPPPPLKGMEKGMEMENQLKASKELKNGELTVKKPLKPLSEEDFIKSLKDNLAYKHINIDTELAKMDAWLLVHKGRQKTRRFIVGWLNRIEAPLEIKEQKPSQDNLALLTQAKEELGRMAKIEDIAKWLKKLPQTLHSQLRLFLISRYPKDADKAWGEAERILKKELQ